MEGLFALWAGSSQTKEAEVNRRIELGCAWSCVVGVVLLLIGFWPIAALLPVPPADYSAANIATFYQDHTNRLRLGLFITLVGMGGFGPITALITRQMLRMKPRQPTLAYLQLAAGTVGWVFLFLPILMMSATAYRPDRSPEVTQSLHDMSFFILVMDFVPFFVQYIAIAAAVFSDRSPSAIFPRWVAYLSLWVALAFIPTGVITFFKTGPFTYSGILGFYIPLIIFSVWLLAMPYAIYRAIRDEVPPADESSPPATALMPW
jgi:hypothetical protein